MRICIETKDVKLLGDLDDTPMAKRVVDALPHTSEANTWGQEVYFDLPTENAQLEDCATDVVEPGVICYWVQGSSLAIPYGPTPVSQGNECRLVTAVNPIGHVIGDPGELGRIQPGDKVTVSLAEL